MKRLLLLCFIFTALTSSTYAKSVGVYCFFSDANTDLYEDENTKLVSSFHGEQIDIAITNKTSKVLYIDKANSFIYLNGTPISLFTNAVHTTGTTDSSGHSVNLGGIARSLGVGGLVAAGLSAVNVGGGSSTQSSTTIYEQRILAIAPHATEVLYSIRSLRDKFDDSIVCIGKQPSFLSMSAGRHGKFIDLQTKKRTKFKIGDSRHYEQNTTPLEVKAAITYSTGEQFTEIQLITVSQHISDIVIDNKKGARNNKKAANVHLPYCAPYMARNMDCLKFISGVNILPPIAAYTTCVIAISGSIALIVVAVSATSE